MFTIRNIPVWKRRIFVGIVSVIFLAISFWLKHSTEDIVISVVLVVIGNLLPFHTAEEVRKTKD